LVPNNTIEFVDAEGKRRRQCVGFRNIKQSDDTLKKRYWHLGIEAKFLRIPQKVFAIRTHVAFSDDGGAVWDDHKKMHRARRRQCKMWFNAKWRDMMLCAVSWLAEGQDEIVLEVGSDAEITVSAVPIALNSPVSYKRSENAVEPENQSDEDSEVEEEVLDDAEDEDA
jgi:hypothetical protein